jgi:predicted dehydrogenase
MAAQALEHGKHVWSEAPVALTANDAERVERAAAAAGRVAHLAAYGPFLDHWRLAGQVIAGGAIGGITHVQSHLSTLGLPEFVPPRTHGHDWRLERGNSLGPAAESLHHQLTSMASVVPIASDAPLSAAGGRFEWPGEQADSLLVEMRSEVGIPVIVTASPGAQPDYVHIRGTLGEMTFERDSIRIQNGRKIRTEPVLHGGAPLETFLGSIRGREFHGSMCIARLVVRAIEQIEKYRPVA